MKYFNYIILFTFLVLLGGCNHFLEPEKDGSLDEKDIWSETRRTFGFLNDAYNNLPSHYNRISGAMLASASDEAIHTDAISNIKGFNNGTWGPYFLVENVWNNNYEGIRKVNKFLENVGSLKIPEDHSTTEGSGEDLIQTRDRMIGEAYFLRAYFHFELMKRYGDVPYLRNTLTPDEAKEVTRDSYDLCMQYLLDDCDSALVRLPDEYHDRAGSISGFNKRKDLGRATVGAVNALKSRALLYWASPLNNPNGDRSRYLAAAKASREVIDGRMYRTMPYRPGTGVTDMSVVSTFFVQYHRELIFSTRYYDNVSIERDNAPLTMGGRGLTSPTQNLADMFGMANGMSIDEPGSGYDPENPYLNRDPRFYMTFAHNGMEFTVNDKTDTIRTHLGGKDAAGTYKTATKTGYYLNKFLSPEAVWDGRSNSVMRTSVLFRYPEVLLNYAEALNEAYDTPQDSVYIVLDEIRSRAGLSPFRITRGQDKETMRKIIQNERAVELAFEEHRFFDVRRWRLLDDPVEKDKYTNIYGMKIMRDGDSYSYEKELVEKRVFEEKMYRYPIPQSELLKAPNIQQNSGW